MRSRHVTTPLCWCDQSANKYTMKPNALQYRDAHKSCRQLLTTREPKFISVAMKSNKIETSEKAAVFFSL